MIDRIAKIRHGIEEAGCDGFFSLSAPANTYLSGFQGSTSAVILTPRHALFLCDFRYTEQAQQQVGDYDIDEVRGTIETRLGERLKALGCTTVGFDPTAHTVYQADTVTEAFGGRLDPLPDIVAGLRMRKDPEEIERIRAASLLAEGALLDMLESLEAGRAERELAAELEYQFKVRGAEGASFEAIALFGARSSLPHGRPSARSLEAADIVLVDCGCVLDGYCSDLTRTCAFGTMPGAWFEDIYAVVLAAQRAAIEAVRPGVRCADVDAVARDMIRAAGYGDHFGHGLGHGVGLEVHEAPRLNMESTAVLEPGMVVTVEPGIYLPGRGGVRIEELVAVTDTGCEVLTQSPRELKVLA